MSADSHAAALRLQESFERAKSWVKELHRQGNPNIVIALVGNKTDLSIKRKVQSEDAQAYVDEAGIMFMETSAKTTSNVNEIFVAIGMSASYHANSLVRCHSPFARRGANACVCTMPSAIMLW